VRIALLADRVATPQRKALLAEAVRLLCEWGAPAEVVVPGSGHTLPRHDLHLLAGEGADALELAAAISAAGGVLLDTYPAIRSTCDRVGTLCRLAMARIPVIIGEGEARRPTHTLDFLGGQVFGVVHSARFTWRDAPITLGPELRGAALRCASVLGLTMFALDLFVRRGEGGVLGVRPFPSLLGVPDAALRLADFVYAATARTSAKPPPRSTQGHGAEPRHAGQGSPNRDVP
jgi:hypothetical protein